MVSPKPASSTHKNKISLFISIYFAKNYGIIRIFKSESAEVGLENQFLKNIIAFRYVFSKSAPFSFTKNYYVFSKSAPFSFTKNYLFSPNLHLFLLQKIIFIFLIVLIFVSYFFDFLDFFF